MKQVIKDPKSNKSVGGDIPTNILKECEFTFSVLTNCIIKSFKTGTFPDFLKEANVTPIIKKDDPPDKENYRQVSILPLLSKVFEKLIKNYQVIRRVFVFGTLCFSKDSQYPTSFIQITSFLAKRVRPKRMCGYNFNGFIKSI